MPSLPHRFPTADPVPRVLALLTARSGASALGAHDQAKGLRAPVALVGCPSAAELHAHLACDGPFAAAVVDARHPDLDRDLLAALARRAVPALVTGDQGAATDWRSLGARAVLPGTGAGLLTEVRRWLDATRWPAPQPAPSGPGVPDRATTVVVVGAPGRGTSTAAAALASGLARPAEVECGGDGQTIVLADLARHADQAALHGMGPDGPGLLELVDAHRHATLTPGCALAHTTATRPHGVQVLPGLPDPGDWACIGAEALDAALASLRAAADWLVIDADADLDDERSTGSFDIEDRNRLAIAAVAVADLVLVVGHASPLGRRRRAGTLAGLLRAGVPPSRLCLVDLEPADTTTMPPTGPPAAAPTGGHAHITLPFVVGMEERLASGLGAPSDLSSPLAALVRRAASVKGPVVPAPSAAPVAVGSLGHRPADP